MINHESFQDRITSQVRAYIIELDDGKILTGKPYI